MKNINMKILSATSLVILVGTLSACGSGPNSAYDASYLMGQNAKTATIDAGQWPLFGSITSICTEISTRYQASDYQGFMDGCTGTAKK